jgi:para-nitrobenzyl esterase
MIQSTIKTEQGTLAVNPATPDGVRAFRGIPYAAAPIGLLRWRPPQPFPNWVGARPTDTFGANSLQGILFHDIDPFAAGVSEDCLFLRRPVLFWIHGGGFVVGSGAEPRYDGGQFARRGIVVVTINHRLNALGFLAHPELTKEAEAQSSGNYGMLDLVAALQWVKHNIEQFGGDPDAVTIAGESAGSMAVSGLMVSPLARGLFIRAIGESGSLLANPTEPCLSLEEAEVNGESFAKLLGGQTLAELRALPAKTILDAAPGLGYRPIVDGFFLTDQPAKLFAEGKQHDVPLIAGWNKDEGFNFNVAKWGDGKKDIRHWLKIFLGSHAKRALMHYPDTTELAVGQSTRNLGGDLIINHGTWRWLEGQRSTGKADIFRYCFDRAPVTPKDWLGAGDNTDAGAFHSCEIPYVFDTLDVFPWQTTSDDRQVSDTIAAYWINFIKTGNPNGKGRSIWPSYREAERPCLHINVQCHVENDIDGPRHRFLRDALR